VVVEHEERAVGESKYSLYSPIRLNFDLMTGFSVVPLQLFSFTGIIVSILSALFVVFLLIRRLIVGPEAEGLLTLFAIAFFLIGITLFGIGRGIWCKPFWKIQTRNNFAALINMYKIHTIKPCR